MKADWCQTNFYQSVIMFLCQHLGVALEEGAYSQDRMSDPTYNLPLCFQLALRLQIRGVRKCRTLRYVFSVMFCLLPLVTEHECGQ